MATIPQKELRNQIGEVLRRVEAGETLTVTVSGREVAELSPAHRRTWVGPAALARMFRGPAPRGLDEDLGGLGATVISPYDR